MAKRKEGEPEKKKVEPVKCRCGRDACVVRYKKGTMVSCSNPLKCCGNFRTQWKREEEAIKEWNNLIQYGGE